MSTKAVKKFADEKSIAEMPLVVSARSPNLVTLRTGREIESGQGIG
jgi:hypothetical protein